MKDELDIPDFLRIPQSDRSAAWRDWVPARPATGEDDGWMRLERERREQKRQRSLARVATLKAKKAAIAEHDAIPTSKRTWCTRTCKWVAL